MKTLPEWIKEIETKRLEDERDAAKEQRQASAEYNAYVSSYRSYSEEEIRDYGHTWGPGFGPEDKPVDELADYDKVQGPQLEVLKKMIERNHPDEDINYIFLSKCGWDDDYPIDKLGEEYTYEDAVKDGIEIKVHVENRGSYDTEEVLQGYVKVQSPNEVLHPKLGVFARIHIKAGEGQWISLHISKTAFSTVTEDGERVYDGKKAQIFIGFGQPDERTAELLGVNSLSFEV